MIDFYLITGFLGAGKTTFIKNFVRLLSSKRIRLIINEFGQTGVDAHLLEELGAVMDEINNGSIFCTCRLDKFELALDGVLKDPPEAVVVEASGLSDPTGIFKILGNPRYSLFDYKGAVCIVDAPRFHSVLESARVCSKQLSIADMVLINKTDMSDEQQITSVESTLANRYPMIKTHRTSYCEIDPEWLNDLSAGKREEVDAHNPDITLQCYRIQISPSMSLFQLEKFINLFLEDTYRVKGFVNIQEGLFLVDCTGIKMKITPWASSVPEETGAISAMAGEGMNLRKSIKSAVEWYPDKIESVLRK